MSDTFYVNFRDQNLISRYPFSDASTLVAADGLALTNETFIDAQFITFSGGAGLAITKLISANGIVTIWLGDSTTSTLASTVIQPGLFATRLGFTDTTGRPIGMAVVDPEAIAALRAWPNGTHTFPAGSAEFVASCVMPYPNPNVEQLLVNGQALSGDVWLVGDQGVVLSVNSDSSVRVDVVGDPYFLRVAANAGAGFTTPRFVKTINGVGPDTFGRFKLLPVASPGGPTPLRITPEGGNTVKFYVAGRRQGAS